MTNLIYLIYSIQFNANNNQGILPEQGKSGLDPHAYLTNTSTEYSQDIGISLVATSTTHVSFPGHPHRSLTKIWAMLDISYYSEGIEVGFDIKGWYLAPEYRKIGWVNSVAGKLYIEYSVFGKKKG